MSVQRNQVMNATYMKTALTLKDHTIVHAKMVSFERERPAQVFNVMYLNLHDL